VSLADQRGKWVVLYFYPMDDTPGCTTEACEFRDNIFAFRRLGVSVLGVSVQDVASKKAFAPGRPSSRCLPTPTSRSRTTTWRVGLSRRETYIIDPQGTVRGITLSRSEDALGQLLADLGTLVRPAAALPREGPHGAFLALRDRRICSELVPPDTPDSSPLVRITRSLTSTSPSSSRRSKIAGTASRCPCW
jgi:peroxiredoxin Q/BCP